MKKLSRFKKKLIIASSGILFICIFSAWIFLSRIQPIIVDIAEAKIQSIVMSSINNAVYSVMSEKVEYEELVTVFSDNSGKITMIQADTVKINSLARETARISQDSINKIGEQGIDIAVGTLTGSPLLAGQGSTIHIKITPIGTCNSELVSEFESAGINQTRHKIYLVLTAEVDIILPVFTSSLVTTTDILVCESILIGDVPDTVVNLDSNFLDFMPNS
ncbi:MAG: sporulation protein YunB [Bacillota bacterium]